MRKSRLEEIAFAIGTSDNGCTVKELVQKFPRNTLFVHLRTLLQQGDIEKTKEPSCGCGRPTVRYRACRPLCMEVPVKVLKGEEIVKVKDREGKEKEVKRQFKMVFPVAKYHRRKNEPPIVWLSPDDTKELKQKIEELRSKGKKIRKVSNRFFDI